MPRTSDAGKARPRRRAPALTPEGREDQLIAMAVDLAEQKLRDGTASNQLITQLIRMASTRERLEKEKLQKENELLRAKTESYHSMKNVEELYKNALNAIRIYKGEADDEYDDY